MPVINTDAGRVATLTGILFGVAGMGSSSVAVAIVPITEGLAVPVHAGAWVVSLYALMLGVTTALYGRLADLYGIRRPLVFGLSLMCLGAMVACTAQDFSAVLVGRLIQGAGAAAVPTLGMALLTARYEGRVRGFALSRLTGVAAATGTSGPLIGGLVEVAFGWRAVMAMPLLALLPLPFLWQVLPRTGTGARVDLVGAGLLTVTAAGLVIVVQSPSSGARVAIVGVVLLVLGAPVTWIQVRRRPHGFLPRQVLRNKVVLRAALAASALPGAWFAIFIAVPALLGEEGWRPWQVGLLMLPAAVAALFIPRVVSPLLWRLGTVRALVAAAAMACTALWCCALGAWSGVSGLISLAVVLATAAFGLGQPALGAAVSAATHLEVRGVAMGVATLVFMVGGSIGSALMGGLSAAVGIEAALMVLAMLPLLTTLALIGVPTRHTVSE